MKIIRPKLYLFDVDGTLRWTTIPGQPCPYRPGEWRLMPRVCETLRRIDWGPEGAALGIASNQDGVAESRLSEAMAHSMIVDTLKEAIGFLPVNCAIEICVCGAKSSCERRKPGAEMLNSAIRRFGVPPGEVLFVGDLESDRQAAFNAGVRFTWSWDFFGWR
ncbi:MAG: hypothetical protein DMF61_04750 [Blastocatellia bacterium AA13]|nr:MAG: hypothetical protein DMF61_04750 [Blastocatellia bacterium AA13]